MAGSSDDELLADVRFYCDDPLDLFADVRFYPYDLFVEAPKQTTRARHVSRRPSTRAHVARTRSAGAHAARTPPTGARVARRPSTGAHVPRRPSAGAHVARRRAHVARAPPTGAHVARRPSTVPHAAPAPSTMPVASRRLDPILGFEPAERADFVSLLRVHGCWDWEKFTKGLRRKSLEEIKAYGQLFLSHLYEEETDSLTFPDGVPKDRDNLQMIRDSLATLVSIREKVKFASETAGSLFPDDVVLRYPELKGKKFWKEEHDLLLMRGLIKHGYGNYQYIIADLDFGLEDVICRELDLPTINDVTQSDAGGTSDVEYQLKRYMKYPYKWMMKQLLFIGERVALLGKALKMEYLHLWHRNNSLLLN